MQAAARPAGAPGPGPEDELAPAGLGLRPDPGSRLLAGGTVLVGGSPVRVLRLTPSGARHVAGWWSGTPVPDSPKARALARRLLDTGIAHPVPGGAPWGPADVTVVIPVRDRQAELTRCLAGLAGGLGGVRSSRRTGAMTMSSATHCPDREQLRAYVLRKVSDSDARRLSDHTLTCQHCRPSCAP